MLPHAGPTVEEIPIGGGYPERVGAVDDYLATLDGPPLAAYERVRDVVLAELPDAAQATSYGMAAFTYRGKPLLGLRAARDHLSVFPFSPAAIDAVRSDLEGFTLSKGTVRFDAGHPLPDDALRALVRARAAEIDAKA